MIKYPIENNKKEIIQMIKENKLIILSAETGAGKSTQVPQYLCEEGFEVVVTQPRRLSCTTLAARVAKERKINLGVEVGYHTGFEKKTSDKTQILYCTDGLQLVKELTTTNEKGNQVLIIDEVHEWNLNIETLVSWVKQQMKKINWKTKVVLMSATMDTKALSEYFFNAPVIDVKGKLFPVEKIQDTKENLIKRTKEMIELGKNILIFQPGKREINDTIEELKGSGAVVLPLHGEMDMLEQEKVFLTYDIPKVIVSTNVAETSITIPDIDCVIDTGLERRIETKDEIEGLYLKDISKANCLQRKGRAGRTKEGVYILCGTPIDQRKEYAKPEIQRIRLDQLVLRLAASGLDATELEFFHQPDTNKIAEAKKSLSAIGAMVDGKITQIGKEISKYPISVRNARMILEAKKNNIVDAVVTIASIIEVGGIKDRKASYGEITEERASDLLAELELFRKAVYDILKLTPNYN